MPRKIEVRKALAVIVVACYCTATLFFQWRHLLGDSAAYRWSYFWTWDMFPGYSTGSHRRVVVGRTAGGQWRHVFPSVLQQYRMGVHADKTRIDFLPSVTAPPARDYLHDAVALNLSRANHRGVGDPIVQVVVFEHYWPPRMNLDDELFQAEYDQPHPHRKYWRRLETGTVSADGRVIWDADP